MKLSKPQKRALDAIANNPDGSIDHYPHGPFAPNTIASLEKQGLIRVSANPAGGYFDLAPMLTARLTAKGVTK